MCLLLECRGTVAFACQPCHLVQLIQECWRLLVHYVGLSVSAAYCLWAVPCLAFPLLVPSISFSCLVALASITGTVLNGRGVGGHPGLPLDAGNGSPCPRLMTCFLRPALGRCRPWLLVLFLGSLAACCFSSSLAGWGHGGEEHGLWAAVVACPCDGMQRIAESGRACPLCGRLIRFYKECSLKDL